MSSVYLHVYVFGVGHLSNAKHMHEAHVLLCLTLLDLIKGQSKYLLRRRSCNRHTMPKQCQK